MFWWLLSYHHVNIHEYIYWMIFISPSYIAFRAIFIISVTFNFDRDPIWYSQSTHQFHFDVVLIIFAADMNQNSVIISRDQTQCENITVCVRAYSILTVVKRYQPALFKPIRNTRWNEKCIYNQLHHPLHKGNSHWNETSKWYWL